MLNRVLAIVMVGAFLAPGAAEGQSSRDYGFFCGGGSAFQTCGSVQVAVTAPDADGHRAVTLKIWNASGQTVTSPTGTPSNSVWTAVGFFDTGSKKTTSTFDVVDGSVTMSGPTRGSDTPDPWVMSSPTQVGGGVWLALTGTTQKGVDDAIASGCADNSELPNGDSQLWMNPCYAGSFTSGGWITLAFEITGGFDPNDFELLVKAQNVGPDGEESLQCITGDGEKANCDTFDTVVPEPTTMILLGTGLAGVALLARRRREDDDPLEEDSPI